MNFFLEGFLLQSGLILGLGAQNLFVLDAGIRRRKHLLIATVCSICDVLLIGVGVLGAASAFIAIPALKITFGVLGVAFLAYYAILKLIEGIRGAAPVKTEQHVAYSSKRAIMAALGFSLLNPHVYLDTVVLVGGYASKHDALVDRAYFGAGAGGFSVLWFYGLALLSSVFAPMLTKPAAMRVLALAAGSVLSWLSFKLGSEVYSWIIT